MAEFEKPRIECTYESENGRAATFVVEPLQRGDADTIGTSLRRVMLAQLKGAAATSIFINGVSHEFSTIPGVKEDVTEIVLNLKCVNFKLHTDEAVVRIEHTGAGIITAQDIICSSDVEVLNPEQHIATLNDEADLHITINVKNGKAWCVADKNKDASMPIGTIAIDSIFSPIERVNTRKENTLVGNSTDYEKLIIEIETNGAITPQEALEEAASLLIKKFLLFTNGNEDFEDEIVENEPVAETISSETLKMTIDDLELSVRPTNCLKKQNINTVEDILSWDIEDLRKIHNLGSKSVEEIQEKLANLGITYGTTDDGSAANTIGGKKK